MNNTTTSLSPGDKKRLRAIGHALKPVVMVANQGLSEAVVQEIERALADHELIKIRFAGVDRRERQARIQEACHQTGALLVQSIGNIALILKRAPKPKTDLSNLARFNFSFAAADKPVTRS